MLNKNHLTKYLGKVPIWGYLVKAPGQARGEGFAELIVTVLFSTLPIWLGSVLKAFSTCASISNDSDCRLLEVFFDQLFQSISRGELLVYILAITGPTLFLLLSTRKSMESEFPGRQGYAVTSVLLGLVAAVTFFYLKTEEDLVGYPPIVYASAALYFFSLVLLYPYTVYTYQFGMSSVKKSEKDTQNFSDGYRRHRG